MKDILFRLQDKTVLLLGPFNGVIQSLLRTLTELGADVAYVNANADAKMASKYIDGVNEGREIHAEYGRAAHFALPYANPEDIREMLGRVAESLGRMDVLVDATPLGFTNESAVGAALEMTMALSHAMLPFFQVKQRGRVIFLCEDPALTVLNCDGFVSSYQESLIVHMRKMAAELRDRSVTVNGISMGVTEDFILKNYGRAGSIRKTLEEIRSRVPAIRLVENLEVATTLAYLASNNSSSLTGHMLRLNHGVHMTAPT
jgi:3-oxoacyl-[acyl-carrier protein] reductase